jgi:hypothetical protein
MTEERRQAIAYSRRRYEEAAHAFTVAAGGIASPEYRYAAAALRLMMDAQIDLVTALVMDDSLRQEEHIRVEVERQIAPLRSRMDTSDTP